jgi:hypothetical protein
VESEDFPGERLVVCRNPLVADDRRRRREELLATTERELAPIKHRVEAGTLRGEAERAFRTLKSIELEIRPSPKCVTPWIISLVLALLRVGGRAHAAAQQPPKLAWATTRRQALG